MGEPVSHAGDLSPWKARFRFQELWTESFYGFSDLDQPKANSIEDQSIAEVTTLLVAADRFDGIDDVGQPLVVMTAYSGIASCSASARTAGRRLSAGTTSTDTPKRSLSSRSSRPNVTRLDLGDRSTRMSISLSAVSCPRATLPKTLTLEAPNFSAIASTCRRRCLRRRPNGVSDKPWVCAREWLEPNLHPMTSGGNQSFECPEPWLPTSRLVGADHALGNMSPPSDVGLRQVGTRTRLAEQ
jgi:hypothetical protein